MEKLRVPLSLWFKTNANIKMSHLCKKSDVAARTACNILNHGLFTEICDEVYS